MASAHTLPIGLDRSYRQGFFQELDPGASGTLSFHNKGHVIFLVTTAAAESRALHSATAYSTGTRCMVVLKTDGGDLTITGAESDVILDSAGDFAEFVVTDNDGTFVWRRVSDTTSSESAQGSFQVDIPLELFRVHDAFNTNLPATAGTDDLGLTTPTIGTGTPLMQADATDTTVTQEALALVTVPDNYRAGSPLSIEIPWTRSDAATDSITLDLEVYRSAAPTVDINSTAAVDVNGAASGTAEFVLTPTNIVPGESLLINVQVAIDDTTTGTGDGATVTWPRMSWLYAI